MGTDKTLRFVLASNLKQYRTSMSLSQEEFADLCGLHRTYISDIERGSRNVSIDNIERIANALQITPSDLLKEDKADDNC
jgi:transcriptional regulator with XRE-family HTH domain